TSAYSLKAISAALRPHLAGGGSVVGLDFDATLAWPIYDWMGVAKAALESVSRYLARDLGPDGIRVNLVSAGPLRTMAAKGIPGFEVIADAWGRRAPLGWDLKDPLPTARAAGFLLSDWSQGITGEILHVDGGYHALMYRDRLWTMRQYSGFGTAEQTNRRFKFLLDRGQTGLSVAFDLPTQMGYDSDHPRAEGEVGGTGVAISSLADMEILLEGIP